MSENPTCSTSYPQAGAGPSRSLPLPIKARTWSVWQGYALKRTGPVSSFYSLVLDIEVYITMDLHGVLPCYRLQIVGWSVMA